MLIVTLHFSPCHITPPAGSYVLIIKYWSGLCYCGIFFHFRHNGCTQHKPEMKIFIHNIFASDSADLSLTLCALQIYLLTYLLTLPKFMKIGLGQCTFFTSREMNQRMNPPTNKQTNTRDHNTSLVDVKIIFAVLLHKIDGHRCRDIVATFSLTLLFSATDSGEVNFKYQPPTRLLCPTDQIHTTHH